MVIVCIWLFEGATVNIGYCSGYCKIFETGLFALCLYECLSGKGATNWSKLLVNLVLVCLNVLAFQELRSQGVTPCVAVNAIFLSDQLAFPECGLCMNVLNVSLLAHLRSFQEPV